MIVAGAAVVVVSEPTRDVAKQEPPWLMGLLVGEGLAPVDAAGVDRRLGRRLRADAVGPIAAGPPPSSLTRGMLERALRPLVPPSSS